MNDVEITKDRIGAEVERAKRACPTCHRSSATPAQPDASALVEVLKAIRELCPEVTGDMSSASLAGLLFNIETRCDAALTAWEAQHG